MDESEIASEGIERLLCNLAQNTGLRLTELANNLATIIATQNWTLLAVTGPSAVGKTAFANAVARELASLKLTSQIVGVDDFLREELRGPATYRANPHVPISPAEFDFQKLAEMLRMLRLGVPTDYVGYTRGAGWLRDVRLQPARVFIVEGLFLDSVSAGASLSYDLLTAIEAPWQYIADLRRQRDAELRLQYESSYRSSLQTEKVIAHTRTAYIQYVRSHETIRRVMLKLDSRGLLESARTY